jgi:hypothetical protein
VRSTISLFHPLLDVKLSGGRSDGEGEVNGNSIPCLVAGREWRIDTLVDIKFNPGTCEQHRPAIAMMEFL